VKNEHGIEMTEKEIIKEAMNLLADVCCLLYETESPEAIAAAWMSDCLIKYLQVIHRGDNLLLASADYNEYEAGITADTLNKNTQKFF